MEDAGNSNAPRRLNWYFTAGLRHYGDPKERRRVQLFKATVLLLIAASLPAALVMYGILGIQWALVVVLVVGGYAVSGYLAIVGRFTVARALLFATVGISVVVFPIVAGEASGIQNGAMVLGSTSVVVCARNERRLVLFAMLTALVAYLGIELSAVWGIMPTPHVGFVGQVVTTVAIAVLLFTVLTGFSYWFVRAHELAEAEVERRNTEMRSILDNVGDGLLVVDRVGRILGPRSSSVERWFGSPADGATLWSYLQSDFPDVSMWIALAWEVLADDVLPPEVALAQIPGTLRGSGASWSIEFRPMTSRSGDVERILVVIRDTSEQTARSRAEEQQSVLANAVLSMRRDPRGFVGFMAESRELLEQLRTGSDLADEGQLLVSARRLHTLKANAAMFGMHEFSRECHRVESMVHEGATRRHDFDRLASQWEETTKDVVTLVEDHDERVALSVDDYRALRHAVETSAPSRLLIRLVAFVGAEPIATPLRTLADQTANLAERLGKPLRVEVGTCTIRHDAGTWRPFWAALLHVVRNAVDHGIESTEERRLRGKPAAGTIRLDARIDGLAYVVSVSDDGGGIDWDEVGRSAARRGLATTSRAELEQALFHDGLSTRSSVTELSGRGVGVGAIKEVTERLGGRIEVDSTPERGTTFRFRFTASAVLSDHGFEPHYHAVDGREVGLGSTPIACSA